MTSGTILKIMTTICIIVAVVIGGMTIFEYTENEIVISEESEISKAPTEETIAPAIYIPTPAPEALIDDIILALYLLYAPQKEYIITGNKSTDIYVCTHFGCDMAENLLADEYNAGVVINNNENHALTWVEIDDNIYIIEPQNGEFWTYEEYNAGQNINIVSLKKGREHMKVSSEYFHN